MREVFYKCSVCGNIVELIDGDMKRVTCCGKSMELMEANTVDASVEKHVPVYEKVDNEIIVRVGEVAHPMLDEHYIMWIALVTEDKIIKTYLKSEEEATVKFPYIANSEIYAYCNLHGLWKNIVR